jgi:hypothetical protein
MKTNSAKCKVLTAKWSEEWDGQWRAAFGPFVRCAPTSHFSLSTPLGT